MRHVINHQVVLSQAPEGPLAPWLDGFADAASRQGYTRSSIGSRIRLAAGFSRWLGQEGIDLSCIGSEHPAQYLRYLLSVTLFRRGFLGLFLIDRGSICHIDPSSSES